MNRSLLTGLALACSVTVTAITPAALHASAVAASPAATKRYVTLLHLNYLPMRKAFRSATVPCQQQNEATCRQRMAASDAAARRLSGALTRAAPPTQVAGAHRTLLKGVRELAAWAHKYVVAIDSGKQSAV